MIRNRDFHHNGLTLRSTVHVPDGPSGARWPTVVFVHGFGANRLEAGSSFVHVSRLLESSGIASVRFDLSGHGESDGDFFDVTITGEIAQARSVVQMVRTLDLADPSRIGLVGMSMGGVVAGIVAAEEPGISAVCLWSPAAVAPFEVGSGYLKGRNIAAEIEAKGYFDGNARLEVVQAATTHGAPPRTAAGCTSPRWSTSASTSNHETEGARGDPGLRP